jgi:hypothetical protein
MAVGRTHKATDICYLHFLVAGPAITPAQISTQIPKMEKSTDYADYTDLRGQKQNRAPKHRMGNW